MTNLLLYAEGAILTHRNRNMFLIWTKLTSTEWHMPETEIVFLLLLLQQQQKQQQQLF